MISYPSESAQFTRPELKLKQTHKMNPQHDYPEITGYAQFPAKEEQRCPISGLKRATLRKYLNRWKNHEVHPVRVLHLKQHAKAKRSLLLYNKADLYDLLNYEAEQGSNNQYETSNGGI